MNTMFDRIMGPAGSIRRILFVVLIMMPWFGIVGLVRWPMQLMCRHPHAYWSHGGKEGTLRHCPRCKKYWKPKP